MASNIQRLFLIRHATSTANLDPLLYLSIPDHVIPLAYPDSDPRASQAAAAIRKYDLPVNDTCSWSSTYLRCRQTETLVTDKVFPGPEEALRRRVSFLLREQEFGDWDGLTDEEIAQRYPDHWAKRRRLSDQLGRFYFRFPNGESRADVVQRVSIFLGKVHRSRYRYHIIFLHGVTQRAFRMAWFDRGPEWFETEPNPTTASVLMICRNDQGRWQEEYVFSLTAPRALTPSRRRQRHPRSLRFRAPTRMIHEPPSAPPHRPKVGGGWGGAGPQPSGPALAACRGGRQRRSLLPPPSAPPTFGRWGGASGPRSLPRESSRLTPGLAIRTRTLAGTPAGCCS